ncbi:beta strand repeat-containing protein, partial [Peijinzhouia sedimentorum]
MNKTSTPNQLFYPQGNSKLIKVFATVFLLFMCSFGFSQTSTLYDFNTTGQLTGVFNSSGPGVANVVESVTGGIGNSGSITVPETSTDAIFATKDGYSLGPVGSTYRFESFIKSVYNSGYSGLGFTPASPAVGSSVTAYRPDNSLGISVHGGGFIFHNGATNYDGSWNGGSSGSITAVKSASIFDLLNSGSPDSWYRIIFVITRSSSTEYDLRVEVWPANDDGTLIRPAEADAIFEVNGVTNSAITAAPVIYSYFSFSGQRVSHFDNYGIELSGGATVVTAGAPVVLTTSSSLVGDVVTIDGNVTSDNGSLVTDRGFVYSTSSNPTITDTKVSIASGTGIFSGSTPSLSTGTYYFRTFATNSEGTSYGSEEEVVILAIPIGSIIITSDPSDPGTDWDLTSGLLIPLVDGAKVNVSEVTAALATGDLIIEAATDVFIDTNIAPALAAARSLTLKANRNVQIEPSASIAPTGNALNTVVWSDADGDDDGMIWLNWDATDGGTAINTNGGHFWMGGGSGSTTWNGLTVGNGVARGNAQNSNGITIISSTIETGGGNLAFYGRGRTGATVAITTPIGSSNNNNGIRMHGGNSIDTGTGTIYMYGYADESGALSNSNGIELSQAGGTDLITNSNTTVDAILLEGYAENNATASNAWGVYTHNSVIQNTSSGTIHLKGGAAKDSGVTVAADGAVLSSSGNIILEGTGAGGTNPEVLIQGAVGQKAGSAITSSSADIEIIGDRFSISGAAPNGLIASSGKLTIRPRTASTTLGIAGGTGTLELPASYFSANFVDGFSSIIIGSEDVGQVNIGTSALSYDDPLTIKTGSSIYFDAASAITGNSNSITLWTRAGGTNSADDGVRGAVWMPVGSSMNTGGGDVTIGGGLDPSIGFAHGDFSAPSSENNAIYRGITINGSLAANGGNISLLGRGSTSTTNARGVSVGGSITTTGGGSININGIAKGGSDGMGLGDSFFSIGNSGRDGTISSEAGEINIRGTRGTGTNGLNVSTDESEITSEATITLEATTGRLNINGLLTGTGGVGSGNIVLISDDLVFGSSSGLSSQGTLTIQALTNTTTIGLNAASGTFSLSSDNLSTNILDGFEEIIIGGASQ